MAGALAALGRHDEAIATFDDVATRAGNDSLYGRMARLGKADAQAKAGQLDAAIASWKTMAAEEADELPADAILMDLARAYVQKGDTAEARKTFTEIVDKHPQSPYTAEARAELANLKGSGGGRVGGWGDGARLPRALPPHPHYPFSRPSAS